MTACACASMTTAKYDRNNMIRAFFAIEIPTTTKDKIHELIAPLRKQYTPQIIRWVQPQNLHITLQFLAALEEKDIPRLITSVSTEIKNTHPLEVFLGPIELFPTTHHPRVISLSVEPNEPLSELSAAIGRGITAVNYPIETRRFRGHLTLGRVIDHHAQLTLPDIDMENREAIAVRNIVLFQSKPGRDGSRYTPLSVISLPT